MSFLISLEEFQFLNLCLNELAHVQLGQTRFNSRFIAKVSWSSSRHFWHILVGFVPVPQTEPIREEYLAVNHWVILPPGCKDSRAETTQQQRNVVSLVRHEEVHCTCTQIIYTVELRTSWPIFLLFLQSTVYLTLKEEFQLTGSSYLPVTHFCLVMWTWHW